MYKQWEDRIGLSVPLNSMGLTSEETCKGLHSKTPQKAVSVQLAVTVLFNGILSILNLTWIAIQTFKDFGSFQRKNVFTYQTGCSNLTIEKPKRHNEKMFLL